MELSDFKNTISSLVIIASIMQFLSITLVCKQYVIRGTTAEASPLPFICGLLTSIVWFLYGWMRHDHCIIILNTVGGTLTSAAIVVFYLYTYKKTVVLKQTLVMLCFLAVISLYYVKEPDSKMLLERLGILACLLSIVAVGAPMSNFFYILRVKNTECLPFPMILMSLVVSCLWFLYGVIEKDTFIQLPNFIGALLALCQLSLFLVFPKSGKSSIVSNLH